MSLKVSNLSTTNKNEKENTDENQIHIHIELKASSKIPRNRRNIVVMIACGCKINHISSWQPFTHSIHLYVIEYSEA